MLCAWVNAPRKGQHMLPWGAFFFSPLFFFSTLFSPLFSQNPSSLGPPRLHRDWADWTSLDIAGSMVVVTDLPCTPLLACSGCLTLLLSFFLSLFFFRPHPPPAASLPYLRFLVHRNKVYKIVWHLTSFASSSHPWDRIETSPTLDRDIELHAKGHTVWLELFTFSCPNRNQLKSFKEAKWQSFAEVPWNVICFNMLKQK